MLSQCFIRSLRSHRIRSSRCHKVLHCNILYVYLTNKDLLLSILHQCVLQCQVNNQLCYLHNINRILDIMLSDHQCIPASLPRHRNKDCLPTHLFPHKQVNHSSKECPHHSNRCIPTLHNLMVRHIHNRIFLAMAMLGIMFKLQLVNR
uniref:Uncharacterized protein n=1 Tax=Arundo donax TaxID=35708 RepID=A0A0A9CN21_ARUDO